MIETWGLLLIGCLAAVLFIAIVRRSDLPEGNLFATGLLLAAVIYVCFALLWGQEGSVRFEATGVFIFSFFAFIARRFGVVWVGIGWLLHIVWNYLFHIVGPAAYLSPDWYPWFCIGFDAVVGVYVLWRVLRADRRLV